MKDTVEAELQLIEAKAECEEPDGETALELLQAIYKNKLAPLSLRMRAARECLPYENPRLSAMAITSMDEHSFARALDRAIARSNGARVIEHRSDEGRDAE
jgi:hypothetical protein